MTRNIELLIFDWDGTLIDSEAEIVAAMSGAIAELGLPSRTPQQMRRMIGLGLFEAFEGLFPELGEARIREALRSYKRRFGMSPRIFGTPFPGVVETLATLRATGFELAVATGKSRAGLDRALLAAEWHGHFRITRCADETASKPDPLMLEEILLATATEPHRALMIGDTTYDMEMAQRAGVPAVGVACGVHELDEMRAAGALDVLDGVHQLVGWLDAPAPVPEVTD